MIMESLKTPLRNRNLPNVVRIPASPFLKKIGFGTGVAVYEMQRSPVSNNFRSPWAVKKVMQRYKKNAFVGDRLQSEANILRKLDHPNIVGFRAFVKDPDGNSVLAMEECSSCLGEMIENRLDYLGEVPYPPNVILKVSQDISNALDYLHNKALLLHADMKSFNVLVKGDFCICKLCDFGVCLPLTVSGEIDSEKAGEEAEYSGTPLWCAPEILKFPQEITSKADIYAFGLIIWEMIALSPPLDDDLVDSNNQSLSSEGSLETSSTSVKCDRNRPPLPDVELGPEYDFVLELYFCCTAKDRNERPGATDLVRLFEESMKGVKK